MSDSQGDGSAVEADDGAQPGPSEHGVAAELRAQAATAVALVAGRNVLIKVIALLGNVVFARLLSPSNFGTVALGLNVLLFVQLLSDGGLGVGLIRRPEEPALADLRVLLGYQLLLTTALAVAIAAVAAPLGRVGLVTAVMMPALPTSVPRAERDCLRA